VFKKLLVPLDRSSLAEQAIGQAVAIARASGASIDLVLVHQVIAFDGFNNASWNDKQWVDERAYLASIADELAVAAAVPVTSTVPEGDAVDHICRRAWEIDADLIVMTSHGRTGLSRAWFGSVADGVLRHSAIPVFMLRPVEGETGRTASRNLFRHLLVPFDGSVLAADILKPAATLAKCADARVSLLRVVQPIPLPTYDPAMPFAYPSPAHDEQETNRIAAEATQQLAAFARQLGDEGVGAVEAHVVVADHVAQSILDFAQDHHADAIAMSTHGRGASRVLMGSVADKVVRASGLPVLLLRPFVTRNADMPAAASVAQQAVASARR
jgi:nucleotide-binding universal stress UspA family protein